MFYIVSMRIISVLTIKLTRRNYEHYEWNFSKKSYLERPLSGLPPLASISIYIF